MVIFSPILFISVCLLCSVCVCFCLTGFLMIIYLLFVIKICNLRVKKGINYGKLVIYIGVKKKRKKKSLGMDKAKSLQHEVFVFGHQSKQEPFIFVEQTGRSAVFVVLCLSQRVTTNEKITDVTCEKRNEKIRSNYTCFTEFSRPRITDNCS